MLFLGGKNRQDIWESEIVLRGANAIQKSKKIISNFYQKKFTKFFIWNAKNYDEKC